MKIYFFLLVLMGILSCKEKLYHEQPLTDKTGKEKALFQRASLKLSISSPVNNSILSNKDLLEGAQIKAQVSSSSPITKCSWFIRSQHDNNSFSRGNGKISGQDCVIENSIDEALFGDGHYYLEVCAEDNAGQRLDEKDAKVAFQVLRTPPNIEVQASSEKDVVKQDFISLAGTMEKPEFIKEIKANFHGISSSNKNLSGSANFIKLNNKEWTISAGEKLKDGEYVIDLEVVDFYGNQGAIITKRIILDNKAPEILSALDGVSQKPYAQETVNYRQRLIEDEKKISYSIEAVEKPELINWEKIPTIYRWHARLDDGDTAPGYVVQVKDENIREVKYKIDTKCASLDEAEQILKGQDGRYEIFFTQKAASIELARNSYKLCLSIWAIDQAGSASNHKVEFLYNVIASPLSIDMNAERYKAHQREGDISWVGPPVWRLFHRGNPYALRKGLVIGHAIISNPHSLAVSTMLKLKKGLKLKIGQQRYVVPENYIDIRYFSYDLIKNEIGIEKSIVNGSAILAPKEDIVAQFILVKDLPISGVQNPDDSFWQRFSLNLGFAKMGYEKPIVDGLTLVSKDLAGGLYHEYVVPWGDKHKARQRSAPLVIRPTSDFS